ncbi:MAG: hypothetical protein II994_04830 [Lachnospiraceae bacterium]|nr:hypothetical protein [Lachnospiraceae bacterium]
MANNKKKSDSRRALEEITGLVSCAFTRNASDDKMTEVVDEYKKEMLNWTTNGEASYENPMRRATQEHWYSLYLGKKRLENQGIGVQYEEYRQINSVSPQDPPDTAIFYKPDGKYVMCLARQYVRARKNFIRNGAIISREHHDWQMDYYITRAQNKDGLYICPNCGAEQTLDKLLDGCDYCKSKFDISAYDDKVMSVMKNRGSYTDRSTAKGTGKATAFSIIMMILGLPALLFGLLLVPVTLGLSLIIALFGAGALFLCFKSIVDNYVNIFQVVYRLQDHNPGFSEEEFIGSLDSKLKSIHYASNPQELAAFVKCDIAPYVKSYQNIVDCETGQISYKKFSIQGDYQYVELHREITVMQDCGNHLKGMKGVVKVVLAKKLAYRLKNDVTMFRCKGCGATISLVEGGKCKYCDNELDYAAYDWVVVGYEHVKEL